MARDLATLRDKLWETFENAVERQAKYEDRQTSGSSTPSNFAIAGRKSLGALGQAIVAVEAEIRAREEAAEKKPDLIKKPAA